MSQLGEIAFEVFNGRDHKQEKKKQCKMKQVTQLATALTREGQRGDKPKVRTPGKQNQKGHTTMGPWQCAYLRKPLEERIAPRLNKAPGEKGKQDHINLEMSQLTETDQK